MAVNQEIVDALVILDTSVTAQTDEASLTKEAADSLISQYSATKDTVDNELNNVDNTTDISKPKSTKEVLEFGTKQNTLVDLGNIVTVNGISLLSGVPLVIERGATSLRTLPNNLKESLRTPVEPLPGTDDSVIVDFIGQFLYVETLLEPDDSETCFTAYHPTTVVPIGQWLLTIPHFDYLDSVNLFKQQILDNYMDDETLRYGNYNN